MKQIAQQAWLSKPIQTFKQDVYLRSSKHVLDFLPTQEAKFTLKYWEFHWSLEKEKPKWSNDSKGYLQPMTFEAPNFRAIQPLLFSFREVPADAKDTVISV